MVSEVNIATHKDAARVLCNAVLGVNGDCREPGRRVIYWQGPIWSLSEKGRAIAQTALGLFQQGHCHLVQRRVGPDEWQWLAIVR